MLHKTIKIKLHISKEDAELLDEQSRIVNGVYNYCVAKSREWHREYAVAMQAGKVDEAKAIGKKLYYKYGFNTLIPPLRKERPWINKVYSGPLKDAAQRVAKTIKQHLAWKKSRKGPERGWPTFHKWSEDQWCSLGFISGQGLKLTGRTLRISLGQRKYVYARLAQPAPFGSMPIKTTRIIKKHGVFYACFTVGASAAPEDKPVTKTIALDPNVKNLVYGVGTDGLAVEIHLPPILKQLDSRIDEVKSKRGRCERESRRWKRYDKALNKLYRKRAAVQHDAFYAIANHLFKKYDCVVIGNWTAKGGINTGMRRVINNQTPLSKFKEVLAWVAKKSGKQYDEINERDTTRTCHVCGEVVKGGIKPNIREWACAACGSRHIRDENAAINILRRFLNGNLLPGSGHHSARASARAVTERCTWRVGASGIYTAGRQRVRQDELKQETESS